MPPGASTSVLVAGSQPAIQPTNQPTKACQQLSAMDIRAWFCRGVVIVDVHVSTMDGCTWQVLYMSGVVEHLLHSSTCGPAEQVCMLCPAAGAVPVVHVWYGCLSWVLSTWLAARGWCMGCLLRGRQGPKSVM